MSWALWVGLPVDIRDKRAGFSSFSQGIMSARGIEGLPLAATSRLSKSGDWNGRTQVEVG